MNAYAKLFEKPICRINIVGTSGSGKSTFGKRLATALNYPYIEIDKIFWGPDWKWKNDEEFFANLEATLKLPTWILDGNYTKTIPIKWKEVDLVIWLDYSLVVTLYQAVTRALKRAWTKEELWEGTGNRESLRRSFLSKESILWWTITTYKQNQRKYADIMTNPNFTHFKFLRLRNHKETEKFIEFCKNLK